ncbi:hypothetical protein ACQ4PT_058172 [Festuca glaucescens]
MAPKPRAKRMRSGGHAVAFAVERLGDLPDALLHVILSFLPAVQVVRMSVLSRRWRDLWRSTPCINIDDHDFWTFTWLNRHGLAEIWRKLEDFTTNLLLFRINDTSLDKFRISACHWPDDELRRRDIDRWVRRGIRYRPQVLEIIISASPAVPFPRMGASSCRLKRLQIHYMYLDNQFGRLLFSGCPVLEDLDLSMCSNNFREFKSRTLRKLAIDRCVNLTGDPVVIAAPRAAYLRLSIPPDCYSSGVSMRETASLVKASVDVLCRGETFSLIHQRRILGSLCNVKNLELWGFQRRAMLVEESAEFPIFANLQTLLLDRCFLDKCNLSDKLEALGSFVQNAPCLEKLTLKCCMFEAEMETEEEQAARETITLQRQDQNNYRFPKLKFVEVMYEEDHDHQLVELVWGIGRKLPDASIILRKLNVD